MRLKRTHTKFSPRKYIILYSSGRDFRFGYQADGFEFSSLYAWAGRDGDVLVVVPIPAAVWLFGCGLIGLIGVARRRKLNWIQSAQMRLLRESFLYVPEDRLWPLSEVHSPASAGFLTSRRPSGSECHAFLTTKFPGPNSYCHPAFPDQATRRASTPGTRLAPHHPALHDSGQRR